MVLALVENAGTVLCKARYEADSSSRGYDNIMLLKNTYSHLPRAEQFEHINKSLSNSAKQHSPNGENQTSSIVSACKSERHAFLPPANTT